MPTPTPQQFWTLVAETGLVDIATRHILFTPFSPAIFRTLDRCLSWLPLGAQYWMSARIP